MSAPECAPDRGEARGRSAGQGRSISAARYRGGGRTSSRTYRRVPSCSWRSSPPLPNRQGGVRRRRFRSIMRADRRPGDRRGHTGGRPTTGTYRVPGIGGPAHPQLGSRAARNLAGRGDSRRRLRPGVADGARAQGAAGMATRRHASPIPAPLRATGVAKEHGLRGRLRDRVVRPPAHGTGGEHHRHAREALATPLEARFKRDPSPSRYHG